jgi:hypothetical protein
MTAVRGQLPMSRAGVPRAAAEARSRPVLVRRSETELGAMVVGSSQSLER